MRFPFIFQAFLLVLSLSALSLEAQNAMIQKTLLSKSRFKQLSGGVLLRDRFGNLYHPSETTYKPKSTLSAGGGSAGSPAPFGMPFPVQSTCESGIFKLHFVDEPIAGFGFSVPAHRDVVCQVFSDLSRLLENHSGDTFPFVHILVASDTSIRMQSSGLSLAAGADIVGTSFEPIKYNLKNAWMDNLVYTTIRNGKSGYINLLGMENLLHHTFYAQTHGLLIVNFKNKTWYTDYKDTSTIPASMDDLYTHTLKQAMHILGIYSNSMPNGSARGGKNLYSRFDNYLYKNSASSKLFTYSTNTKQISNTTSLPAGCTSPNDIRFIGSTSNLLVYNDTPWNSSWNLSNFSCGGATCNASYAKPSNPYVTVPCLQGGHTYVKRHPHSDEVYALCNMGYKLRNIAGKYAYGADTTNDATKGNVYKTYSSCTETCIAVGGHDTIWMDTVRPCTRTFSAKILSNDIPANAVIRRLELLDTTQGSLTYTTTGFTFTPKPYFKYGEVRLVYFPQCDSTAELGNATYITIRYPYPPLPPCLPDEECNSICYGTFEESDDPNLWHGFLVYEPLEDYNTADLWHFDGTVTCRRNVVDNYWADCNVVDSGCNLISYGLQPHVDGGSQFIGIYAESGARTYTEGFHFKLKKPIFYDTTKYLKIRFLAKVFTGCASNFRVQVVADDTLPIAPPNPIRPLVGGIRTCAQYCDTLATLDLFADTWAYYSVPIKMPKPGDSFTDIIVLSDVAPNPFEPSILYHYCYFDNFEIYDSLETRAVITSNPHSLIPCNDSTQTVVYQVCLENAIATNSDSIIINIKMPYGFTIASGSDFDANGRYKIPAGAISNTICDTLILKYNIDFSKVATDRGHTIVAGYSCNEYCVSEESDWVRVYPKNNSVVLKKYANNLRPQIGQMIDVNYEICNYSPQSITDLKFTDTFPLPLRIQSVYTPGLTIQGQILSLSLSLDSAYSVTNPRCIQLGCIAEVMSNCRIPTTAYLYSVGNPCFRAQDTLTINDTMSGSPVQASIYPPSAVWCNTPVPLKATITNPGGSYTYQWIKNSTNVGNNSANYLATTYDTFSLKISQNGCTSLFRHELFDTGLTVIVTRQDAICTTSNGSIILQPINGVRPYTYTWAGSTSTDSFRAALAGGTYAVTITDSIGCSRVLQIAIPILNDTILVAATITQPICSAPSGAIQLSATGGYPPYSYLWQDGDTTASRAGLTPNLYRYVVTDVYGCARVDSLDLRPIVPLISISDSLVHASCATPTGSIYITPSGGTAPYTYLWQDSITTQHRINVNARNYSLTVSDANGCKASTAITLPSYQDSNFKTKDSIRPTMCSAYTGAIYLYDQTGTPPYSYLWNTYDTSRNLINQDSGIYTVIITDANGCIMYDTFYVPRDEGFVSFTYIPSYDCINMLAQTTIQPLDGYRPYFIYWADGDTSRTRSNMTTGLYTVSVYDSLFCHSSLDIPIDFNNTIFTDKQVVHPYCGSKGSLKVTPITGYKPYEYYWYDLGVVSTDSVRTQLDPGQYIVAISDSLWCYSLDTLTINPDPKPTALDAYISAKIHCQTGGQSELKVIQKAGHPNLSYLWSTGATTSSINVTATSTRYWVTVTEPSGCLKILSIVPHPDSFLRLGDGYGGYGYADLQSAIAVGRLTGNKLDKLNMNIKGKFTLNANTEIRYCNILMNEGAIIDVPSDCNGHTVDSLTMLNNQIYTCGDKLAHGITIRECIYSSNMFSFNLIMKNNTIKDCYKALEIRRSLIPHITNNLFEDNMIGMHIFGDDIHVCTPFPQSIIFPTYLSIYGNKFRGSGTTASTGKVKIPYNGLYANQYTRFRPVVSTSAPYGVPLAGIIAENTRTLQLGHGNASSNIFENLNNGILAYGSEIYVYNTLFKDMLYKASTPMREYAIYAEGNRYTNKGSLILGGYSSNALPHVSNTLNGIYAKDLENTNISGVYFKDVRYSIYSESNYGQMFSKNLTVRNNKIEGINNSAWKGIEIQDNTADNFYTLIENNTLTNVKQVGIRAIKNNLNFINSSFTIQNNTITGDAFRGIHLLSYQASPTSGASPIKIIGNTCRFNQNMQYGIHYSNCKNISDKENTVKGSDPNRVAGFQGLPTNAPFGYFYDNSTGTYSCNLIDSCYTGVRFFANCDASTWSKNKIRNHRVGLKIDTLATLRDHYWAGNTFTGNCFREAQSSQRIPTVFYYSNTSPEYLPSPRFPGGSSWWRFRTKPGVSENDNCNPWIYGGGGTPIAIGTKGDVIMLGGSGTFTPIGRNNTLIMGIEMTTTDTAILMNNMIFGSFESELTWQYRKDLYNKIKPYEFELRDTSIFRDYLTQMEDGSINEFTQINVIDRDAYQAAQAFATQVNQLRMAIDSGWEEVKALDSAYQIAIDSTSITSLKRQRTQLRSWIWTQDTALRNLLLEADSAYQSEIEQIQFVSDSIVPECISDSLRNIFLATYYQTYAIGQTELTAPQIQTFSSLANHCPFEQLDAVYRSRGILWSRGDTTIYNDSILCVPLGITLKSLRPIQYKPIQSKKELSFSIFPNPTKGHTNIQLSFVPSIELTYIVTDMVGRELYKETRLMDSNRHTIDMQRYENGMYLLRVLSEKEIMYHTNIQVLK